MKVLVTGGTGVLGEQLVRRLRGRAEVVVLSRRPPQAPGFVRGDLETGEGLAGAFDGVDAVAHCASSGDHRRPQRDVAAARRLLAAARPSSPHLVYISIVGVDRIGHGYFRAKLATERLIETSRLPWTVLRTTQFHDLALLYLQKLARLPVAIVPRGVQGQPVDAGEVADRMAELVLGPPAGRVPDLGGPRVEEAERIVRSYLALTGRRRPVLRVPLPGKLGAGFRAGHHLAPDGPRGTRSFEDYLRSRLRPDGTVIPPYPRGLGG